MKHINGAWRSTTGKELEPKELEGIVSFVQVGTNNIQMPSATTIHTDEAITLPLNTRNMSGTAIENLSDYKWRWDGMRWIHEADWTFPLPAPIPLPDSNYAYPGVWKKEPENIVEEEPEYAILKFRGKTLIYRILDGEIEYGFIEKNGVKFIKSNNLSIILKMFE
jgi:hypothetical protein